jgi:hypothetical protein
LGGLVLGAVFLIGAVSKAVDPLAFREQIHVEGLDAFLPGGWVVLIALALEFGLGTALVLGIRRLWILVPSAFLVVLFIGITGRSYWNYAHGIVDESVSCGCFGNLVDRTPAEAFWQDLLLMVPALVVAFLGRPKVSFPVARAAAAALVTIAGVAFSTLAPRLPLDDIATRLKPGKAVEDICAGNDEHRVCLENVVPELLEGDHVVIIADLTSPQFGEAVTTLNQYHLGGNGPLLWVLSSSTPEESHRFFWQFAPTFQPRDAPRALLRSLYRKLPRSFTVTDGKVTRTFPGLPPLQQLEEVAAVSSYNSWF